MFVWLAKLMSAYKFVGTTREPSSHHTISTQESFALARGTRCQYYMLISKIKPCKCEIGSVMQVTDFQSVYSSIKDL